MTQIIDRDTIEVNGQSIRLALSSTPELFEEVARDTSGITHTFLIEIYQQKSKN